MSQTSNILGKIKNISIHNCKLLDHIINMLKQKIKGKRELMYSDIINLIIREGYIGDNYSKLILWCNYNIRLGKTFIEFE